MLFNLVNKLGEIDTVEELGNVGLNQSTLQVGAGVATRCGKKAALLACFVWQQLR